MIRSDCDAYCGRCGRMFEAHEWQSPCPKCGWDGDDKKEGIMEISHRSGVEGPRHDPYHWDEYVISGYNKKFCNPEIYFTVHRGLANWFSIRKDGWKIPDSNMFCWEKYMEEMLFNITGMTFDQVVEKHEEEENRLFCPECNEVPEDVVARDGYPGETVYCCPKCGSPCGSDQDMSAVI